MAYSKLWLGYTYVEDSCYRSLAASCTISGFDEGHPVVKSALRELTDGLEGMTGCRPEVRADGGLVLVRSFGETGPESYTIQAAADHIYITADDETGLLYGVFALLRGVQRNTPPEKISGVFSPENPLRMLNHWDNMTNDIERGYSGDSFFFHDGQVLVNERTRDYARLISSVGINGTVINNVNVKGDASYLITDRYFEPLSRMAEIFAEYGVKLFLSLNFAAPIEVGGMETCDPFDPAVIEWWKNKMAEVYERVPNFGGFLVKADSEGRPGPFTYGRTQADGANMLADLIAPYGGIIIWRCFVYNCTQDWRDRKTDRARAGYDNFVPMDGSYHDNVILQIKNGPMDFQIREPVHPLLGGLVKTNQMLEVQIAQEYTGHQIDICYLIPMFKEVLDFHTYCRKGVDTVRDIISGRTFGNCNTGFAAVANTGNDDNWTGNDMAAANLYGFGRLSFDMGLGSEEIAREWVELTFGRDQEVVDTLVHILMHSREIYEKYTSPLGIGWMVTPQGHYGPSVDGYEYSRWGTYHRADHEGIGVDRSDSGTGYALQYHEPNASMYNQMETCPEQLLLFFHHVPYTYMLKTGKTLIQHIYDSHFEGYEEAKEMAERLKRLEGRIPDGPFATMTERMERQLMNAREWRDQVNSYFYRKSGIPDQKGREIF